MPGPALGARDTAVNETDQKQTNKQTNTFPSWSRHSRGEKETINQPPNNHISGVFKLFLRKMMEKKDNGKEK